VLQAVITTLCEVQSDLAILALDVSTNYIRIDQINDYIAAYLNANTSNLVNAKMIPFVALEFYGDLFGKFDATGAGIGAWKDINLCNGNNGTPDKRGRVAVCAITDMAGGALDPEVDPAMNPLYNPNYVIDSPYGFNFTTLNETQLPSHAHPNTVFTQLEQRPHKHGLSNAVQWGGSIARPRGSGISMDYLPETQDGFADITVTTFINNGFTGGSQPHTNVQPVYPCYYIMYIPT
jgi:microcystin-dependent protein